MHELGFIGAGAHGCHQMRAFAAQADCSVRAIFDVDSQAAEAAGKRFESAIVCSSMDVLLALEELEAVVIATPAETHAAITEACLKAGKHVLIEKPLAHDVQAGEAILASAAAHPELKVLVGHAERFNRSYIDCKKAVSDGAVGVPRFLSASRLSPLHLNDLNWVLGPLDTAVHDIDILLWLIEDQPISVTAQGNSCRTLDGPCDTIAYQIEFSQGALAQGFISWVDFGPAYPMPDNAHPRLFVHGTGGSLQLDLWQRPVRLDSRQLGRNYFLDDVLIGYGDYPTQTAAQAAHFIDCLNGRAELRCSPQEAYRALFVAYAAHRSRLSGGKPVAIDAPLYKPSNSYGNSQ
ncbi:MAG: Gfo/Idh/MocA family oxidoreductase [Opitutales bacterium]|nr:Gfo/Idh/MocA family oxidoreductase [Opitutales bacterium]